MAIRATRIRLMRPLGHYNLLLSFPLTDIYQIVDAAHYQMRNSDRNRQSLNKLWQKKTQRKMFDSRAEKSNQSTRSKQTTINRMKSERCVRLAQGANTEWDRVKMNFAKIVAVFAWPPFRRVLCANERRKRNERASRVWERENNFALANKCCDGRTSHVCESVCVCARIRQCGKSMKCVKIRDATAIAFKFANKRSSSR